MQILLSLCKSWHVDAEVSDFEPVSNSAQQQHLFADTFGIWADRDIDLKEMRRKARERRNSYSIDNVTA
jgi:hypothetical protein